MHRLAKLCLAVVVIGTVPASAVAQRQIELGIDGAVSWTKFDAASDVDTDWQTSAQIPVSNFRIGFLSADRRWSVEPNFSFSRFSFGESNLTNTQVDVGLLYHFAVATRQEPGKPQPYLRPFLGFEHGSISGPADDDNSDTRMRFGVGLGVKLPMVDRLATRLEARYTHTSEGDAIGAANSFGLGFGLSFFTR
jgi:opacity protein-like surface antigen